MSNLEQLKNCIGEAIVLANIGGNKYPTTIARNKTLPTCWVPGTHDDSTISRRVLDLPDDLRKLVNTLTCIVGITILVLGPKVTPLESINRAQVPNLAMRQSDLVQILSRAIALPDLDTFF